MVEFASAIRVSALGYEAPHFFMGLDLALATVGIVVLNKNGVMIANKTLHYPLESSASEHEKLERLLNTTNEVVFMAKTYSVGYVSVEDFAYRMPRYAHQVGEMRGTVKVHLYLDCGIVARSIGPTEARKAVLGYSGKAAERKNIKDTVVEVVRTFEDVEDDHQADAWVVAMAHFLELKNGVEHGAAKNQKPKRKRTRTRKKAGFDPIPQGEFGFDRGR